MPGIFGFFGTPSDNHLIEEMGSLLTHNKSWFDYYNQNHPFGFHGVSDFKNISKINRVASKQKSIVLYGNVFYFKNTSSIYNCLYSSSFI